MKDEPENRIFSSPALSDDKFFLQRPRINAILEKALDKLAVFVIAGEGYGKTCAVHSFLSERKKKVIRIPISERDNVPRHFWESVIKAVTIHEPLAAKVLEEIGFPESPGQITRCLSVLAGGVPPAQDRKEYVIVVDDCHLVHNETILNFANQILVSPFPRETVIMISREESRLNTMSLLSKGLMSSISADDLRFSEEEIAGYFRLRNIRLSPRESRQIHADTEGWILAICLVAGEMKTGNNKYSRSLLENGGFGIMEEKMFSSIPASIQRFLVILSLFDQWPLEAVEKMAASLPVKLPPLDELMENINRLGPLVLYDAYIHGFRIHRLFLDYLRKKQKELPRDELKTACAIAAQWCMKNDLLIEAAHIYGMAGNYEGLYRAVYSFPRLISQSAAVSFLKIINMVLNDSMRDEEDDYFLFLRHETRAKILINLGRYAESRAVLDESIRKFETMPQSSLSSRMLSVCYNTLGALSFASYHISRDLSRTLKYYEHGNYYYKQHPYTVSGTAARVAIGSYANFVGQSPGPGEYEEYINTVTQCIPYASESSGGNLSGMDSLCLAELAFFRGDPGAAEQHAREAIFKANEKKQYETESKALFYLLRIHLHNGDASAIGEPWQQMEAQLDIPDYINRQTIYDINAGWFYAHIGKTEKIAPWLKSEYEESDLNLRFHNFEIMVKAKSLFAEGRYSETLEFLERKEAKEGMGSYHLGMLEITVLEAAIHSRMGNGEAALKTLETAHGIAQVSNGRSGTFDMPFIELGEDMRDLVNAALGSNECAIDRAWLETIRNRASVYAKKMSMVKEQFNSGAGEEAVQYLSSQELLVLRGISRGLTNEEIARDHSLSVNTIKSIIKILYEKLKAHNRADAIRKAIKSGFLSATIH